MKGRKRTNNEKGETSLVRAVRRTRKQLFFQKRNLPVACVVRYFVLSLFFQNADVYRQSATDCGDGDWWINDDENENDANRVDGVVFLCVYARDAGRDRGGVRVRVGCGDMGDEQTRVGVGE